MASLRTILTVNLLVVTMFSFRAFAQHPNHADTYQVVHSYPHDPDAFTQGLIYIDGHFYESTGRNGMSSVRMVDPTTGRVLQRYDLTAEYFGEGLTDWQGSLVQITWQNQQGFVYDQFSLTPRRTFKYKGEGWGLTHDATRIIMSDGTAYLRFLDPRTFTETSRLRVTDEQGKPVANLNELEYIHGEVYANIWQTDYIVRISPHSGKILGWIDLSGLLDQSQAASADVLNGIAYDAKNDRLFVTGKLWPRVFEIKVVPRNRPSGTSQKLPAR
jgi:glutamine cyclotransferase